ncbi:MAG: hypothetical protein L3K08_08355, partial [Thermoplasmata archaeon]|nr:hypothetical protein [Thermoplasmata archaeon]
TILGNLTVPGLLPGEYSLSAMAPAGRHFLDWAATGSVQVSAPLSPWATVVVRGNGTVRALFSTGPASLTAVRFDDSDPNASVQAVPGFSGSSAARLPSATTVPAGGTLQLEPGIYSINARPSPGSNFTSWTVVSGLADLSAPLLPFT